MEIERFNNTIMGLDMLIEFMKILKLAARHHVYAFVMF
jgi:hypothetical protein